MKTLKFFAITSLALIIAAALVFPPVFVFGEKAKETSRATLRYEVYLKIQSDIYPCMPYVIQISDENGNPVAHPQEFVPGISKYVFTEQYSSKVKIRIATFDILQNGGVRGCPITITTKPDINVGPYFPFGIYYFRLEPQSLQNMEKE